MDYILSLGTNLGDRMGNLRQARRAIAKLCMSGKSPVSAPVYSTEPVDVPAEFNHLSFLNTVVLIASAVEPRKLLERLQCIEQHLGRVRCGPRNGPRTIDIDIITAGGIVMNTPDLVLPHPHAMARRFVLQPLVRLCPNLVLPTQGLPVRALLDGLPVTPRVTLYTVGW